MRFAPASVLILGLLLAGSAIPTAQEKPATTPATGPVSQKEKSVALPARGILPGPFPAEVLGVIDGDTLEARVTVWLGQTIETRVRLRGIDAAEMSALCEEERALAAVSRTALARMTGSGKVYLAHVGRDKYAGRVVATLLSESGENIGDRMLREGYAIAYDGGRRQPWCETVPMITARR